MRKLDEKEKVGWFLEKWPPSSGNFEIKQTQVKSEKKLEQVNTQLERKVQQETIKTDEAIREGQKENEATLLSLHHVRSSSFCLSWSGVRV